MSHVEAQEVRRVRLQLGKDQTKFGARFGRCRRTVIRWEKEGTHFTEWGGWRRDDGKTEADLWRDLVAVAKKNVATKSTTAVAARKPAPARRRVSAKKAVAVKRRRVVKTRRRSVVKGKKTKGVRRAK